MRATSVTMYSSLTRSISVAQQRVSRHSEEMATGARVIYASDNPTDASQLMRLDTELHRNETFRRTTVDANGWVATIDKSLTDVYNILARADELALGAVNGSLGDQGRLAIAQEVRQLRSQAATAVNATYLGQAVFAGHSAAAVDATTYAFTGVVGQVIRQLDLNTEVDVSANGQEIFGFNLGAGQDVFAVLDELANAIDASPFDSSAVVTARTKLETNIELVLIAQGDIGTRTQTIDQVADRQQLTNVESMKARMAIGDTDLAKASLDLASARAAYQAALQAAAQATLPTLADYLS